MKDLLKIAFILTLFSSCLVTEEKFSAIPPGYWKGILYLGSDPKPSISLGGAEQDNKLPFIFEVNYATSDSFTITIHNGQERILLHDIDFGHNRATGRDSLVVRFPEYGSYIKAYYEEDILEGRWYDPSRGNYSIPFLAKSGIQKRFDVHRLDVNDQVGEKYDCTFGIETDGDDWPAIGEFKQSKGKITGTFLTETGDYRYLEGIVDDGEMYLSTFDGAHAFLFKAKVLGDSLSGFFKSGNHYETLWSGKKSENVQLTSAYNLTQSINANKLSFKYIDPSGDTLTWTPSDENNKPTLVQIMGSWCPNCKDETLFLNDYLKKNPGSFNLMGVAFERTEDIETAYTQLERYKAELDIDYPFVYAGKASKNYASEVFSDLSKISSFPTLIFLDPMGNIYKIHTGFSGPATSGYKKYQESFFRIIEELNRKGNG